MAGQRMPGGRGVGSRLAALLVALSAWGCDGQGGGFDTAPCGRRFRIATHMAEPFIFLDPSLCVNQLCPPAAFGADGGFTYEFMMQELLPMLKTKCRENGASDQIEFDWYLPVNERTSAQSPVNMVCHGGWALNDTLSLPPQNSTVCPSTDPSHPRYYKGASASGNCTSVGDSTCTSPGPDMVVGAVHILADRLRLLQFSLPYYAVSQTLVKRPDEELSVASGIYNVFACFSNELYIGILAEVVIVWIMFMIVEAPVNEDVAESWVDRPYDVFYWVFSGLLGGADKAPSTVGGRLIFVAHAFFSVIVLATYTGGLAAFLTQQAAAATVTGFESLESGQFSTVVRGPSWDVLELPPPYLGILAFSRSTPATEESTQFKLLQSLMRSSRAVTFKIITTQRMDSRNADGTALVQTPAVDPCSVPDAQLGAFDLLMCGNRVLDNPPDTLMFDSPSVIYELNKRKERLGTCPLVTIGRPFNPGGFGVGFPYRSQFHVGFSAVIANLTQAGVVAAYEDRYRLGNHHAECEFEDANGGIIMTLREMLGLFIVTAILLACVIVHSIFERMAHRRRKRKEKEIELVAEMEGDQPIRQTLDTDEVPVKADLANLTPRKLKENERAIAVPGEAMMDADDEDETISRLDEMKQQLMRLEKKGDILREQLAEAQERVAQKAEQQRHALEDETPEQENLLSSFFSGSPQRRA